MRSHMEKRVQALEGGHGVGGVRDVRDMTDEEIYRALNVRDPATGALRMDLTDAELEEMIRDHQAGRAG